MANGQELQAQEKRELQGKDEPTIPARTFVPTTDIYETEQALTVVMEMPGVGKTNLDINVENDVLSVTGPSISRNTRSCSQSIRSTTSGIIGGALAWPRTGSTRRRSRLK